MIEFSSLEELKSKINPVLVLKSKEINVDKDKIFEYLSNEKWKKAKDLHLFEIIDDIIKLTKEEMSD